MTEIMAYLLAAAGSALLIVLVGNIRALNSARDLKSHRHRMTSLADMLVYAAEVADGVIVTKGGAFLASFVYMGDDNGSATEDERERIAAYINSALQPLGTGWMIHVDAVRHEEQGYSEPGRSHFPDIISLAIDEERRRFFAEQGTAYGGHFVITFTWFPPTLAQSKFVELMFDDDSPKPDKKGRTRGLLKKFEQELRNIENRLSLAIKLKRLRTEKILNEDGTTITKDNLLGWLQYCVTGEYYPVMLPRNPMYLDSVIGGQELWSGTIPKLGQKYIQTVSIEGFPLESQPGILTSLAEQPCEYRWSTRFIFLDQTESAAHFEKFRKQWKQKIRGFLAQMFNIGDGTIDQDALEMTEDAEVALAEVNSGMVAAGYYTSVIVLMDEDREVVEGSARLIEKAINRLGFVARIETINTMDAFFGTLPGHGYENIRRPLINTMNLADMLPTSSIWTGESTAPCPFYAPDSPAVMQCLTNGSTPFWLNLHVRDLGHTLIFGPTGAGKSVLLCTLAAQLLRYQGMHIYSFDKGNSMYALTKAVGGLHFSIASDDDTLAFAPLQFLETDSDRAWAAEWVEQILGLNDFKITPAQRNAINEAIRSMAASGSKTLSDFATSVQDNSIREALKQYLVGGSFGHLLDAQEDGLTLSSFTCFEIEDLMNLGQKYALPVLLYIFRRIERSLKGQPAVIFLDEAWLMLSHPVFREKIREWLKVLRKANCAVVLATQSLSDAERSGIIDVLTESTATKIFLPNIYAHNEDTEALYRKMGLNSRQIDIIAYDAVPKRDYYMVSEHGRRLFSLAIAPLAFSFLCVSDKETLAVIRDLERRYGRRWPEKWLEMRDIRLSEYVEIPKEYDYDIRVDEPQSGYTQSKKFMEAA
jgi:type IV secretion system protein VirB4